jgi:hypothetical protein
MLSRLTGPVGTVGLEPRIGGARSGLVVGTGPHRELVSVAMFRPAPTRVLAVGTDRFVSLIGFRALALGAELAVASDPARWSRLTQQYTELPPSRVRPLLTLVADQPSDQIPQTPWSTQLVARGEVGDLETYPKVDLVLMQPVPAEQAAPVGAALGLPESQLWSLSAIPGDFVIVASGGTVTWARLSATAVELSVLGDPAAR